MSDMINLHETNIVKDASGKKLIVTRDFSAPLAKTWRAWTESSLLDQWWAPKPYKVETKNLDFRPGGVWLYAMVAPTGEKHWCRVDIKEVEPQKRFSSVDMFCDENGNPTDIAPPMHWVAEFAATETGTRLTIEISFESEDDLNKIVGMGFKEGFTMALGNLDELFAQ
jgi:uncharacterized protein YndB with AHSA1/START domain